jgi:hypothetical protein
MSFMGQGGWENMMSHGSKQGILKGEYHCTVDLLFDWFGISCMTTDNFCFFAKQTNPNQSNRRSMVQ